MKSERTLKEYFNTSNRKDIFSGGVTKIPINTPFGEFKVWTKRIGNNPNIKILLLHGGPGATHEYLQCFDSFFPREGFEYYYYDQLGSFFSDQPKEPKLWMLERFVEEVEQVRLALNLNKSNFYLYGHSWGGTLATEYALKYQQHLKGLIISNMMLSIPDFVKYLQVLGTQIDPEVWSEIQDLEKKEDYTNPRYTELISLSHFITDHFIRMPSENWPEPFNRGLFTQTNIDIVLQLMGPSQFSAKGTLKNWDRTADVSKITVPTLFMGAKYDMMDPDHIKRMATKVKKGEYHLCPQGSHSSLYDDQEEYFKGLIEFINKVNNQN